MVDRAASERLENLKHIDRAWNLIDMAQGLSGPGKAHDLMGEALAELSLALFGMKEPPK